MGMSMRTSCRLTRTKSHSTRCIESGVPKSGLQNQVLTSLLSFAWPM